MKHRARMPIEPRAATMTYVDADQYSSATTADVVEVISHCKLVETTEAERVFWRRLGAELAPGFYVVVHPHGRRAATLRLGDDAVCRGPFRQRHEAEAALGTLLAGNARARTAGAATAARSAGGVELPRHVAGQPW